MTICIFVLLLAGLLIAAQKALSTDGAVQVVVTVDGKSYGTYSLKREQVIRIETEYGYKGRCNGFRLQKSGLCPFHGNFAKRTEYHLSAA